MARSTSAWTACRRRPRRGLAAVRAHYNSETSLFGDFAGFGTEAYAEAGAWAEGEGRIDVGPANSAPVVASTSAQGRGPGRAGRQSVRRQCDVTGGVGVRTGVSASVSGDFDFGIDRVGGEVDLGGSLGLGFDASVGFAFSPSGLATGAADVAGDVAEEIPAVGGLFRYRRRPRPRRRWAPSGGRSCHADGHDDWRRRQRVREASWRVAGDALEVRAVDEMVAKVVAASPLRARRRRWSAGGPNTRRSSGPLAAMITRWSATR